MGTLCASSLAAAEVQSHSAVLSSQYNFTDTLAKEECASWQFDHAKQVVAGGGGG